MKTTLRMLAVTGLALGALLAPSAAGADAGRDLDSLSPPTGEPAPIAGQGYHQVFRDDFDILDRLVWDDHIWYDEPPDPLWLGFQAVEPDGILHLRSGRRFLCSRCAPGDWPINTVTTLSSGKAFQYGYFEARMKWTKGQGSWPAFWLISSGWARTGSCSYAAGEIDVFEGQGSEPDAFYGTVHRDSSNACVSDLQNANNWQPVGVDLTADFHTYGALWTSDSVSWYLDGSFLMSAPTYATSDQPMFLLLQEWVGGWDGGPDATTPDVIENQVDYVQVWQK